MEDVLARGEFSLRQLMHFVTVAEAGSISAASGRLFMSQSAISASITELERALGTDLCVRRRAQGVSLTPMGKLVLEGAKSLLAEATELAYLVRGAGTELVGPLVSNSLAEMALDVAILGVDGLSVRFGATTLHEGEADVSQQFAKVAKKVVVVADSTKMEKTTFARICPLDQIDVLVTDRPVPAELERGLGAAGVEIVIAS